jgi:ergothioneine biosynthesis protein EgtB
MISRYRTVRRRSASVCAPLTTEDHVVQSMPDASPAKWHLAHTTWFFETFVLKTVGKWSRVFNSYYDAVGPRVERAHRGTLSRPTLEEVHAYRDVIDQRIERTIDDLDHDVLEIGLHHEQQHQELMLTDLKHALGTQALQPAYRCDLLRGAHNGIAPMDWVDQDEAIVEIGADGRGFSYDNERPRHRVIVAPFQIATRPIANAEVLAFIGDGGYTNPALWLADGFATVQREGWRAPLYWEQRDDVWMLYDFGGVREVDPAETACHLSYYEADAIARWAGARLPTEFEWECVAQKLRARDGHWADDERLHPRAAPIGLTQVFGDVWEWTSSAYAAYPGFAPLPGALGEYNGKFMSGQMVLRGGSCLTPRGHVRASYRNFFPPSARWQMSGVRLAQSHGGAA